MEYCVIPPIVGPGFFKYQTFYFALVSSLRFIEWHENNTVYKISRWMLLHTM